MTLQKNERYNITAEPEKGAMGTSQRKLDEKGKP